MMIVSQQQMISEAQALGILMMIYATLIITFMLLFMLVLLTIRYGKTNRIDIQLTLKIAILTIVDSMMWFHLLTI